jgi:hypothetical protein
MKLKFFPYFEKGCHSALLDATMEHNEDENGAI